MRLITFLCGAVRGIAGMARDIASAILFLAAVAASAAVVAVPAWLLASRRPGLFTAITVALLAASIVIVAALGTRRAARAAGGAGPWAREHLLPAIRRFFAVVAFLVAAYGIALLFAAAAYAVAVPTVIVYLVLLGRCLYVTRRGARTEAKPAMIENQGDGRLP